MQILLDISPSKSNQIMRIGQLMGCSKIVYFRKSHVKNEVARLVPSLFLFFKKALHEVKAIVFQLKFNMI